MRLWPNNCYFSIIERNASSISAILNVEMHKVRKTLSKTNRFKALLASGYFPEELPPPFNTLQFAVKRESILKAWQAAATNYPKSSPEIYSLPNIKKVRRNLSIVNPVAQLFLAKIISENWVIIRKHLETSPYALQVPEINLDGGRAVPRPDFPFAGIKHNEISANYDYALISDISRFYGTLYTHTISWAFYGKAQSKRTMHTSAFQTSLGNSLDVAVRKGQDNQTIGIPVGPDTSRIISEIIAVSIDDLIQKKLKVTMNGAVRHVDDWYFGFDNFGDAENAVSTLAEASRVYEFELNSEKTKIIHSASTVDDLWPTDLREFKFLRGRVKQSKSIKHYFIKAFQYAQTLPEKNVLSYAVNRSKKIRVMKANWHEYETFLLKAARSNQTVISSVVQILVSYNSKSYELGKDRIKKLIDDLIRKNSPIAHHSEVAWSLFLAKALNINISDDVLGNISKLESSVCALLALDLQSKGLISRKLNTSLWRRSMNSAGLKSNMWLLAYEAHIKGWLAVSNNNYVDNDSYFSILKAKKVSFYDTEKNIVLIDKEKPIKRSSEFLDYLAKLDTSEIPEIRDAYGSTGYY